MRNLTAALIILVIAFACSKRRDHSSTSESLIGKWKLTNVLYSDGARVLWRNAGKQDYAALITFQKDGSMDVLPEYQFNPTCYQLLSDSTMNLIFGADSVFHRFKLDGNILTIYPPAFEPAANKYRRVN